MTRLEMRLALYLLGTLLFNGMTIAFIASEGGWNAAFVPVMGAIFAVLLGRTWPRRDLGRSAVGCPRAGCTHRPKT